MSFMSFQGRIGRGMWWLSNLIQLLLVGAAIVYVAAAGADVEAGAGWQGPVYVMLMLLTGWIGLCANIKRYHDRGKSGFWVLICFVPLVGAVWMLIELGFLPGTEGGNAFGPSPGSGPLLPGSKTVEPSEAAVGTSKLAKLDDAYFRDYAANKAAAAKTAVAAMPSAGMRDRRPARAAFGKRG